MMRQRKGLETPKGGTVGDLETPKGGTVGDRAPEGGTNQKDFPKTDGRGPENVTQAAAQAQAQKAQDVAGAGAAAAAADTKKKQEAQAQAQAQAQALRLERDQIESRRLKQEAAHRREEEVMKARAAEELERARKRLKTESPPRPDSDNDNENLLLINRVIRKKPLATSTVLKLRRGEAGSRCQVIDIDVDQALPIANTIANIGDDQEGELGVKTSNLDRDATENAALADSRRRREGPIANVDRQQQALADSRRRREAEKVSKIQHNREEKREAAESATASYHREAEVKNEIKNQEIKNQEIKNQEIKNQEIKNQEIESRSTRVEPPPRPCICGAGDYVTPEHIDIYIDVLNVLSLAD